MKLIVIGDRVINCDHVRSVLFNHRKARQGAAFHLISFDDVDEVAFLADSPEGAAVRWFFGSTQHPFIWTRPHDILRAHANFLASEGKTPGIGAAEPEIESLIEEFRDLPREQYESAFENHRLAPVA